MNHILQVAENQIKNYLKIIGIYEDIYENKEVTEVLINTNKKIFTKVLGKGFVMKEYECKPEALINLLKVLSTLDSKQLTEKNPNISTKLVLSNGQKVRIEGLIAPTVENPTINIRKQSSFLIRLKPSIWYLKKNPVTLVIGSSQRLKPSIWYLKEQEKMIDLYWNKTKAKYLVFKGNWRRH